MEFIVIPKLRMEWLLQKRLVCTWGGLVQDFWHKIFGYRILDSSAAAFSFNCNNR